MTPQLIFCIVLCLCRHQTSRSSSSAVQSKASLSAVSKVFNLSSLSCYKVVRGAQLKMYSLLDIHNFLGLKNKPIDSTKKEDSDAVAVKCFKKILKDCHLLKKWGVKSNVEIPPLSEMADFQSSSKERPDIIIYNKNEEEKIALTCEVQSSPMFWTEQKAILGATNLLRNFRENSTDITSVTVFAIPNTYSQNCIIEIVVEWSNLLFKVTETRFSDIDNGITRLKEIISLNCHRLPKLSSKTFYFMKLSPSDLSLFEQPQNQLLSKTHLVVKSGDKVFKLLYQSEERESLQLVMQTFEEDPPAHVYNPKVAWFRFCPRVFVIQYTFLKYDHMFDCEAEHCCRELVKGIQVALKELHDRDISHNDIRLENILFNSNHEPILVDLDRAVSVDALFSYFNVTESCMYTFPKGVSLDTGVQTDYFQLGWLVASILTKDKDKDYHDREWETEPFYIRDNKFIASLITKGVYDQSLLNCLPQDTKTIQEVLEGRQL